jgi:hypothetical protein
MERGYEEDWQVRLQGRLANDAYSSPLLLSMKFSMKLVGSNRENRKLFDPLTTASPTRVTHEAGNMPPAKAATRVRTSRRELVRDRCLLFI